MLQGARAEIVGAAYPLIIILIFLAGCSNQSYAELYGKRIDIEIAQTPEEKAKGLMSRDSLCGNCGMLFIFEDDDYRTFWMKNTPIPLDLVFINSEMEAVDVLHTVPCYTEECPSYTSKDKAKYVLEVNAGMFDDGAIGKKLILR